MILFHKKVRQWPAKDMPEHLRSEHLISFASRANPAILFDKATSSNRLTPLFARVDKLDPKRKREAHLCLCCRRLLANPGKTRTCHQCSLDLKLIMVTLRCQTCKKPFERRFSDYTFRIKRGMIDCLCSNNCRLGLKRNSAKLRASPCKECGSLEKPNQNDFCSFECYNKNRGRLRYGGRPCSFCGSTIIGKPLKIKACSEACRRANQTISMQKTYLKLYGKPEERSSLMAYPASFYAMRNIVIARDEGRCALCNMRRTSMPMHVHHIDRNRNNSSTENLITLCRDCHLRGHGAESFNNGALIALCKTRDSLMPESWQFRASKTLEIYADEKPRHKNSGVRSKRRVRSLPHRTCK